MSEVSWITCATEGRGYSPFPMDAHFEERARRTHEGFYCPAGHSLYFGKNTAEEKRIASLEEDVEALRDHLDRMTSDRDRLRRELARCRWVGCDFQAKDLPGLWTHMRAMHGMPTLSEVREAS